MNKKSSLIGLLVVVLIGCAIVGYFFNEINENDQTQEIYMQSHAENDASQAQSSETGNLQARESAEGSEETDDVGSTTLTSSENTDIESSKTEGNAAESSVTESAQVQESTQDQESVATSSESTEQTSNLRFRTKKLLESHYKKHGIEMGFSSAQEYEKAAAAVVNNPDALHKTEKEDGDDIYYIESTNEIVFVSTAGYIRTYFWPNRGIDYYNEQ